MLTRPSKIRKRARQPIFLLASACILISFAAISIWSAHRLFYSRPSALQEILNSDGSRSSLPWPRNWLGPSDLNRAIFSSSNATHRDFCTAMPVPNLTEQELAWVTSHSMDLVNRWPANRLTYLSSAVTCHWASHRQKEIHLPPIPLCVHDPTDDTLISGAIIRDGWWGSNDESKFMLGGGYAAGTPLNRANASAMRAAALGAALAGVPRFESTAALVAALQLPPPEPHTQSACSRERPVVLDVGGNIGLFADAFAASGCSVVVIEPLTINAGRFWQSMQRNNWTDHVWLYKNAIGLDRRLLTLQYYTSIHGQSKVLKSERELGVDGVKEAQVRALSGALTKTSDGHEAVATLMLEDLFDGQRDRPVHPWLLRPIEPTDIAAIKVDVEDFDGMVMHGLRRVIEIGLPPLLKIEFTGIAGDYVSLQCRGSEMLRWLYGIGYHAYVTNVNRPLELAEWESFILPLLLDGDFETLSKRHGIPRIVELMLVHDNAPVPAVIGATGPGGRAEA